MLRQKSFEAYEFGKQFPGVCQTASCLSPYFYEEDNWTDDMQLAASVLYSSPKTKDIWKMLFFMEIKNLLLRGWEQIQQIIINGIRS